jgi:exosome complex component RRP45
VNVNRQEAMINDRYVAVRDDAGPRSLSLNERVFLRTGNISAKSVRVDGRQHNDVRKVRLELGRWDNGSKCTVQWGMGTRVTALCSAELVPPSPDHPNEGMVDFSVDLSPMAGTSFRQANPVGTGITNSIASSTRGPNYSDNNQRLQSNRILRCVERIILVGGVLDTEALVLMPGKWVWRFAVALTVLDDGGNIIDACTLAAITSLRHYRKPKVDLLGDDQRQSSSNSNVLPVMIPSTVQEATPLPLHHTPISITFALVAAGEDNANASSNSAVIALVDPTDREELVQLGSFTIATNIHSEVCLLDYGGGCELLPSQLRECWAIGETAAQELCGLMEDALQEADDQARKERLDLLQGNEHGKIDSVPNMVPPANSPYFLGIDGHNDILDVEPEVDLGQNETARTKAEEVYRKQALDYTTGHVASTIREDVVDEEQPVVRQENRSLLAAMLKSVGRDPKTVTSSDSNRVEGADNVNRPRNSEEQLPATETDGGDSLEADDSKATVTENRAHGMVATSTGEDEDEDEDEEDPVVLRSEFDISLQSASAEKKDEILETSVVPTANQGIADLSMTIKKRKPKKKGKK